MESIHKSTNSFSLNHRQNQSAFALSLHRRHCPFPLHSEPRRRRENTPNDRTGPLSMNPLSARYTVDGSPRSVGTVPIPQLRSNGAIKTKAILSPDDDPVAVVL